MQTTVVSWMPCLVNDPQQIMQYCDIRALSEMIHLHFCDTASTPHVFTFRRLWNQVERTCHSGDGSADFQEAFVQLQTRCRQETVVNALAALCAQGWVETLSTIDKQQRNLRPQLQYYEAHPDLLTLLSVRRRNQK